MYSDLLKAPKDSPVFLSEDLDPIFMLKAYSFGLFPWSTSPVTWWCPDPRMILFPKDIYRQKSIRRFFKFYECKLDENTMALIKLCADTRELSWIDEHFIKAYEKLLDLGFLHSLELYDKDELVGGIYGLIIGKIFFAESMVSIRKNVSKIAMIKLCDILEPYDFLIDCQVYNKHLEFMGAKVYKRKKFLELLEDMVQKDSGFTNFKIIL